MTDQVTFDRIRRGTKDFDTDWLTALDKEERVVDNFTTASDA